MLSLFNTTAIILIAAASSPSRKPIPLPAPSMPPPMIQMTPPPPPPPPPPPRSAPTTPAVPIGSPARWVTGDDYPSVAMRNEEQGMVRFMLDVGPDGRATRCVVTHSSGSATLDDGTCRVVMRRARFRPAKDGDGNAIAGRYASAVNWVLPKMIKLPIAFTDAAQGLEVKLSIPVDEKGNATGCSLAYSPLLLSEEDIVSICQAYMAGRQFPVRKDAKRRRIPYLDTPIVYVALQ